MEYTRIYEKHYGDSRIPSAAGFLFDGDAYARRDNRFCLVDGITRDLRNGNELKMPKTKKEILEVLRYFPYIKNPRLRSLGQKCASLFVSSNKEYVPALLESINDYLATKNAFECDYLGRDYYGYTLAAGIIKEDSLDCIVAGDSKIYLFDKYLYSMFKSYDSYNDRESARETYARANISPNIYVDGWNSNEARANHRRDNRNTDSPYSFCAITGESEALAHTYYYSQPLREVEYIMAITDGYLPIIEDRQELKRFMGGENIRPEKEGTIVAYQRCKRL